ncbi:VRR-NUC domain-containing protein [Staphylococcus pseudintermedius]|uniref:VRR-NUC domain-containing protein n=1 Tax=Staphylococcus pseudintermedius TaxID=283734 RepID=UPI00286E5DED|nr:VRR-NUC domain-containing protein [Staphylococcus pseudintermedius]WMZ82782.1 VRR-NUC domain-containing protein [Staphylococcus pseudintermedius]
MKETNLEQYLVKEIKKENGLCLKWVSPGTKGVPDRIIIMPDGKTYFVEMKQNKGRIDPLQKYMHKQFNLRGHKVYVLWTKEQVNEFVKKVGDNNGDKI